MEAEVHQSDGDLPVDGSHTEIKFLEIQGALIEHKRRFQEHIISLLRLLRNAGDDSLRALGDRLDFHDFYANLVQVAPDF